MTPLSGPEQLTGDLTRPLDLRGNLKFEKRTEILNLLKKCSSAVKLICSLYLSPLDPF